MRSMTGFGSATRSTPEGTATVAIAAVNHRGLALSVRSDLRDLALEERLRALVREQVRRGSVTVQATWQPLRAVTGDRTRIIAAWRELAAIAREAGAPPPTLEAALNLGSGGMREGSEAGGEALLAAAGEALTMHLAARAREGAVLRAALAAEARELRRLHAALAPAAAARLPKARDALRARLTEALGRIPLDEAAIAREIAAIVDRLDVQEELVRLGAHLDELDRLLASSDPELGRQLEFLVQEIGREINTTGAKANDSAVSHLVLSAKNALERLKEQAANVE